MNHPEARLPEVDHLRRRSLVVGVAALALCAGGAVFDPPEFFHAYLTAYLFWIGIALGCLAILMLHHLVSGRWGFVIQRLLESGCRTLPLMALLFVPLLFGLRELFLWARPEAVAAEAILRHRQPYLNGPFFSARVVLYFAVWITLASLLSKWSLEQDRTAAPDLTRRLTCLSGPGLILYGLTVTFAAFDWVMTLGPQWHSTIFGAVFMVGQGLAALCFVVVVSARLADRGPLSAVMSPQHFHDLGNLILAFVMLWAYMAFSQYLIIWSGNLQDEIPWYLHRMRHGWFWLAMALIVFHFVVPFMLLLSRVAKRRARILFGVAAGLLVMRFVDLYFLVVPALHPERLSIHWMDVVAPVGVGGIWLWAFLGHLRGKALVPLHDPRFAGMSEPAHEA
ncbi:MAG: hypothetical protein HY712_05165 [candidate division NC10 bacterium]|nr:hypothetical protein [candidate division NC10 bacterium]